MTSLNIESKKTRPITYEDLEDPVYVAKVAKMEHEYVMWLLETMHDQAVEICEQSVRIRELEAKLKALGH